ncbi:hypothetical protein G6L37_06195 [Agrobacterium rubi]|nr:hypothetical protein [Agrobacterium rubi]NTF24952.1 hypothetical protein [Agrobacterium rubi]
MGWGCDPDTLSMAMAEGAAERTGHPQDSLEYKIAYREAYQPVDETEGNEYLAALDKEIDAMKAALLS